MKIPRTVVTSLTGLVLACCLGAQEDSSSRLLSAGAPADMLSKPTGMEAPPAYHDTGALGDQSRTAAPPSFATPDEPLSEFQKFVVETTGQVLPVFGRHYFVHAPSTFAPVDQIPMPANGTIGPGDLLRIRIWGQVNFNADVRVDRAGEIYLPQVGAVHVAGLPYSELDQHLKEAVGRLYRNFELSSQLGQIRSIQIFVVGHAEHPGTYTVSSLSTLVDAIFASGGPALDGSLRHLQLKRGGVVVTDLDLYKLLLDGDKSADVPLQPGDVLFVPVVGPQVAVLGSVKTAGIYEERTPGETVDQVLADAGGLTSVAGKDNWSLEHFVDREAHATEPVPLDQSGLATQLYGGDILRIEPSVARFQNTVTLRGNTANPGRYRWHVGMHLSELFPDREVLLTRNYWWQRAKLGLPAPEFEPDPNLDSLRQPAQSAPVGGLANAHQVSENTNRQVQASTQINNAPSAVQARDSSVENSNSGSIASAASTGEVQRHVVTENIARTQSVTGVSLLAPEIDWKYAVIERLDPNTLKTTLLPFDLGRLVLDHDATQDLALQSGDVVTIFSQADIQVPQEQQTRLVRLEGEFVHAGVYSAAPGETLQHLVDRAGGLAPGAYLFGSDFTRASVKAAQQQRLDEYITSLQLQLNRGVLAISASPSSSTAVVATADAASRQEEQLISQLRAIRATGRIVLHVRPDSQDIAMLPPLQLEDGDVFYVPPVPSSVNVIGAVYDQNAFAYLQKQHVRDYLQLAGGTSRDADEDHAFLIRADGSVISQHQIGRRSWTDLTIAPGDALVIPEKSVGPSKLRTFLDFSQLFSQLAIGAAVISVLQ